MQKISSEDAELITELYETGKMTQMQLATMFRVTDRTIRRYLKGIKKPFGDYDVMDSPGRISLDELQNKGFQFAGPNLVLLPEKEQWSLNKVQCPSCTKKMVARSLLKHLIKEHQRFDLEYLTDEYL